MKKKDKDPSAAKKRSATTDRGDRDGALGLLGGLSVDDFLRHYWQRKPLLVRGARPEFCNGSPVSAQQLFAHAASDTVESRLVKRLSQRWSLEHGPFERLPALRTRNWTLLVQGMDLVDDAVHAMLQQFRFIPDARLDDVMISFATPGGGVGPHLDSYDVFLLQASGTRRWGIRQIRKPVWQEDTPLRLLADWQAEQTFDLGPGDMLYLPPGWGHDGVALEPCTTWSIGFRTPSRQEFLSAWLSDCADRAIAQVGTRQDERFRDPGRLSNANPGAIPADLSAALHQWLNDWRADERGFAEHIDAFIGRHLSEPKAHVFFDPPSPALGLKRFRALASRYGVTLDRRARLLYDARHLFVNGEIALARPSKGLRELVDHRRWNAAQASKYLVNEVSLHCVYEGYRNGWLQCVAAKPDTD